MLPDALPPIEALTEDGEWLERKRLTVLRASGSDTSPSPPDPPLLYVYY